MKRKYLLLTLCVCISGCTTAFEIGESLNRATTNVASNPKVLWDTSPATFDPASAPVVAASAAVATTPPEPTKVVPQEIAK